MIAVIVSFLVAVLSGALTILILNYSVYIWENKKIKDLSSRIKHNPNNPSSVILEKKNSETGFTTKDLGSVNTTRNILKIDPEDRKVIFTQTETQPKWISSLSIFIKNLRQNFWVQIKNIFNYLLHLTRHVKEDKRIEEETKNEEIKKSEIAEVIQKVKHVDDQESPVDINKQVIVVIPKKPADSDKTKNYADENLATINMATQVHKEKEEMDLFEKLEDKLLQRLKEVGMNHYDIWVDLGKLYEKHQQKEKAVEIYSLVLKHSQGREKEYARDRLIEIS